MVLAGTSVSWLNKLPKMAATRICIVPRWLQLPPCILWETLKISRWVWPRLLRMTAASALAPWACEILCASFKEKRLLFPTASECPECSPHWPSKSNVLGIHLPGAGPLEWGSQYGAWTHSTHEGASTVMSTAGHLLQGMNIRLFCISALPCTSCCGSFITLIVNHPFY